MATTNALRQLIEAINDGNLAAIESLLAPEYLDHDVFYGEAEHDRSAFLEYVLAIREAFPDLRYVLEDEAVSGDRIWGRLTATATMRGPFAGHAPTGKSATWNEMHVVRIDPLTGRLMEHWGAGADLSMFQQLGLLPELER